MSGPISINVSVPGSAERRIYAYHSTNPSVYHIGGMYSEACFESRPASVRSTKDSSGWRPPLPWSHTKSLFVNPYLETDLQTLPSGTIRETYNGDSPQFGHSTVSGRMPSLGDTVDRAINKALMQLSNQQADFGENYAEREQTDRLIGDRVNQYTSQLTGRYITRHRRDWRDVKRVSPLVRHGKKYPESWLAFQYGVQPLLSDIYGAYQLMKRVDKDYSTFRINVKATVMNDTVRIDTVETTASSAYTAIYGGMGTCHVVSEGRAGAFVRLDYAMVNPALVELQQLGMVNPVLLAWNLLPYSFVLDWALPVGNYLQSWTADLGYRFLGGSISTLQTVRGHAEQYKPPTGTTGSVNPAVGGFFEGFKFNRTVLHSSPAPRMPHFKNPLTLHHAANALSLLAVALAK